MMPKLIATCFHLAIFIGFASCDNDVDFKVQVTNCIKQIDFENADYSDSSFTYLNFLHQGFCFGNVDSIIISRKFFTGTDQIYHTDSIMLEKSKFEITGLSGQAIGFRLKLNKISDSAKYVATQLTAIYDNQTQSNILNFQYQFPCKKEISKQEYHLLDTSSCETSAGTGDRFWVTFSHKGYCTQEIDSIAGHGNFYSYDGYFWNSSSYLIPKERIFTDSLNTYQVTIRHRLCITFSYSDYVHNEFYAIYTDGTRSNIISLDIHYNYYKNETLKQASSGLSK